jgi:chromate transport protein ChrA
MTRKIGNAKLFLVRAREYAGWLQFVILMYTSLVLTPLKAWHLLVLLLIGFVFLIFDWKVILPSQLEANWDKIPQVQTLIKNQEKILQKLERKDIYTR